MLPVTFTPQFMSQLELLRLRAKRSFLGSRQGQHRSLRRGTGIEFADHREYQPGDSPRSIDWGAYARTEKLYVKRAQEDENLTLLIALDCSGSMGIAADQAKWNRACELALALAYIGLMEQDRVIFAPLGSGMSTRFKDARSFHQLVRDIAKIEPHGNPPLETYLREAHSKTSSAGIAVFISDFFVPLSEVNQLFLSLRSTNLEISALQVIGDRDLEPFPIGQDVIAVDSETLRTSEISFDEATLISYKQKLTAHNLELSHYFAESRVNYLSCRSNDPLIDLFTSVLPRLGLVQ